MSPLTGFSSADPADDAEWTTIDRPSAPPQAPQQDPSPLEPTTPAEAGWESFSGPGAPVSTASPTEEPNDVDMEDARAVEDTLTRLHTGSLAAKGSSNPSDLNYIGDASEQQADSESQDMQVDPPENRTGAGAGECRTSTDDKYLTKNHL